jgi:hypothetical protein
MQINRCFTTFPEPPPRPEFISNAANESGNEVVAQYKLVPVDEHPIFPGGSSAYSLTEDQYNSLKETEMVFATLVKNESLKHKFKSNDVV